MKTDVDDMVFLHVFPLSCRIWLTAFCTWDLASWRLQAYPDILLTFLSTCSLFLALKEDFPKISQETEQTIIHLRRLGLGNGKARFPRQTHDSQTIRNLHGHFSG